MMFMSNQPTMSLQFSTSTPLLNCQLDSMQCEIEPRQRQRDNPCNESLTELSTQPPDGRPSSHKFTHAIATHATA